MKRITPPTHLMLCALLLAMLAAGCATTKSIAQIEADQAKLTQTEQAALEQAQKAQERRKALQGQKKAIYQEKAEAQAKLAAKLKAQAEAAEKAQAELKAKAEAIPEDVPEAASADDAPKTKAKGYVQVTIKGGTATRDETTPYPDGWSGEIDKEMFYLLVGGAQKQALLLGNEGCFRVTPNSVGPCKSE